MARREEEIVTAAARKAKIRVVTFDVHSLADAKAAFAAMSRQRLQVTHLVQTAIVTGMRQQLAALAIEVRVPLISAERSMAEAGGLITYGPRLVPVLKRGATYVDRILKGAKPQELPIEQAGEFELVVNLKTAKAIAVSVPSSILSRADYVIR